MESGWDEELVTFSDALQNHCIGFRNIKVMLQENLVQLLCNALIAAEKNLGSPYLKTNDHSARIYL